MEDEKIYNKTWASFIELLSTVEAPWAPGEHETAWRESQLQDFLKQNPEAKNVLILGATPSIRDICSRLKLNVTCLGAFEPMYNGMTKLLKVTPYNEKLVLGTWQEMDTYIESNSFDVVISDVTQSNMTLDTWSDNFKNICNVLRPHGIYISSFMCFTDCLQQPLTIEEALKEYNEINPTLHEVYEQVLPYFDVEHIFKNPDYNVSRYRRDMVLRPR